MSEQEKKLPLGHVYVNLSTPWHGYFCDYENCGRPESAHLPAELVLYTPCSHEREGMDCPQEPVAQEQAGVPSAEEHISRLLALIPSPSAALREQEARDAALRRESDGIAEAADHATAEWHNCLGKLRESEVLVQELLGVLKKAQAGFIELHAQGIGCPACPDGDVQQEDGRPLEEQCEAVAAIERAIAAAEGRSK